MGMGYWPDNTFTVIYKQNGKVVAAPTVMVPIRSTSPFPATRTSTPSVS